MKSILKRLLILITGIAASIFVPYLIGDVVYHKPATTVELWFLGFVIIAISAVFFIALYHAVVWVVTGETN